MKVFLSLAALLFCLPAAALPDGTCWTEPRLDDPTLRFEELPYMITEFNDPREVSLADSLRYTTKRYGHCENGCEPLSEHNAERMGAEYLWQEVTLTDGTKVLEGCGGGVKCREPIFTHNVQCKVEKADCDATLWEGSPYLYFKLLKTYNLECIGTRSCYYEDKPATDCCVVVGVIEANEGKIQLQPGRGHIRSRTGAKG